MPLGADPQKNIEEIHKAAEHPDSRFYKMKQHYSPEHFGKIVEAAAYRAAREHGFTDEKG